MCTSTFFPLTTYNILSPNRGGGNVRHCRIVKEGNQFIVGSAAFDSLSEIVDYYKANSLYRGQKLKYAVNEEVVKRMAEVRSMYSGLCY